MNTWATVFLGIIALATLVTAVLQIVLLVAAASLVKRVSRFVDFIESETKPILESIDAVARDASRVASLAVAQVERADQLLSNSIARIEQTLGTVQTLVVVSLRVKIGVKFVPSFEPRIDQTSGSRPGVSLPDVSVKRANL